MASIKQGECEITFKLALSGQAGESGDSNEIQLEAHVVEKTSDSTFDFDPSANAPLTDKFICLWLRNGKISDHKLTLSIDNCVFIPVGDYKLGKLLNEGKTKQIYDLPNHPGRVLLLNKDKISAHNGVRMDDMEGKAAISNQTNAKVFELLNKAGVKTAFVQLVSKSPDEKGFIAVKCEMVPIEWVTR